MPVVELPPGYAVREFRPEDAAAYSGHLERLTSLGIDAETYLHELAQGGCFTVLKHGIPVGSAGVTLTDRVRETVWFLASDDVRHHPKLHLKIARQFLAVAEHEYALDKMYATSDPHDEQAATFLRHCGFTPTGAETVHGQAHVGWVRVRA